jgi:hypothetical protein
MPSSERSSPGSLLTIIEILLDWTRRGRPSYPDRATSMVSAVPACGAFLLPYTKKKNAANPTKNIVPPTIHVS